MQYEIEEYQLAYHTQKGPQFRIKVKGGNWGVWVAVPSADLAVVALILNEKPAFYNSETKYIYTGEEPTGS